MNRAVLVLLHLMLLLYTPSLVAQDAAKEVPDAAAEDADEEIVEAIAMGGFDSSSMLKRSLAVELDLLKSLTGVSDDAIAGLKLGLEPLVARVAKEQRDPSQIVMPNSPLPPTLLTAVMDAAEHIVTDKAAYEKYREDVEIRVNFTRRVSVRGFIQMIDELVGLSSKQIPAIRKLGEKLESEGKLNPLQFVYRAGNVQSVKAKDLKEVLSKDQLQFFSRFNTGSNMMGMMMGQEQLLSDEKRRTKLVDDLRLVAKMKIAQVNSEFTLSPQQNRKLQLVSKQIISKATDKRLEAEDGYRKYMQQAQNGAVPAQPDMEMMSTATASLVMLFNQNSERWQKFLKTTLTDEQNKKWTEIKKERSSGTKEALGYMLVIAFGSELKLSGKQQLAVHALVFDAIKAPAAGFANPFGMIESYEGLLNIKEADYVKAMGEDNWQTFKPQLDQLKMQIDQMKNQGKGGEEAVRAAEAAEDVIDP